MNFRTHQFCSLSFGKFNLQVFDDRLLTQAILCSRESDMVALYIYLRSYDED